ncbi:MAG: ATP-binding protein [Chloroflexota bacterium]
MIVIDPSTLIGRSAQLNRFGALMTQVSSGENTALILTGQEATGKTSLLRAFQAAANADDWVVLNGSCETSTATDPYNPFLTTLGLCFDTQGRLINDRSVTSIVDSLPLDDILSAVVDIPVLGAVAALGLVGKRVIDARRRPLEGEELINRNFEFVRQVFEQIGRRRKRPILLSFDDLHHAGETTLSLVSYLLTRLEHARLLFIAAWQPSPTTRQPSPALRRLGELLPLPPLDPTQTQTLVQRLSPTLPLSPERLDRIFEFSHGLPGLTAEIVHLLAEGDDPLSDSPATGEPSTAIETVVRRYLECYPPQTIALLECAAALGRHFALLPLTATAIQTYLGLGERRILETATELAREGRVLSFTGDDDTLQFTSEYLHAYLVQRIPGPLARRDQLRLAQGWQHVDANPPPGPLARLYFRGGDHAAALEQASRAATELMREAAYPEALQTYELAIAALNHLPPTDERIGQQHDLLYGAAFAAEQAGEWAAAIRRLEQALSLVGDDDPRRADLLGSLGWLHFKQGDFSQAATRLRQSAACYEMLGDRRGRAQIDYYQGALEAAQKNWGQAIDHFERCIAAGQELDDDAALTRVYLELGNLIRQQRRWAEAEELFHKGITLAEAAADHSALAEGYHYLGVSLGRREQPQAIEILNKALDITRQHTRQPHQEAKILNTLAETYVRLGRWNKAVAAFEGSEAIKRRLGDKPGLAMTYGGLGRLYHRQWRAHQAAEYYQKDLDILRQQAEANAAWIQQLLNSLAEAHRLAGDFSAAEAALTEAMTVAAAIPDASERDRSRGYTHLGLARLELSRHRPEAARPHAEQGQALLRGSWMEPEADRVCAWLERLAGNLEAAQTWLDKALPRLKDEDYERLMAAHEAAQLAQARGQVEAARQWWRQTLEVATRLNNQTLQNAAQQALAPKSGS